MRFSRAPLPERVRGDAGYSLMEVLVAMSIFTVILVIFTSAMVSWTKVAVRDSRVSDQTTDSRVIFDRLDKQVPSAAAINRPQLVNGNWYVEFQTDAVSPSTCTQWVFRTATSTTGAPGTVAYRTWSTGTASTPVPTAWTTLTTRATLATQTVAGVTTTLRPWTVVQPGGSSARQQLVVDFDLRRGTGPLTEVSPTLVLRNSTSSTLTYNDANNDGVSDNQVCQDISGARP